MTNVKGKYTEKWSEEQKQKAERTIDKMKESRYNDYVNLRDEVTKKLEFVQSEKKKLGDLITSMKEQINKQTFRLHQLAGAEAALLELLQEKEKKENAQS